MTIDSQIWIYYFDNNAKEHTNTCKYIENILNSEMIQLSALIPIEVAHRLFKGHEKKKELNMDRCDEDDLNQINFYHVLK